MRDLKYRVGANGYYTTCNTLASAKAQQAQNPNYTIEEIMVERKPAETALSPIRKAMLDQFGVVKPSLKSLVSGV